MIPAIFIKRQNRFVAEVELEGRTISVYVPSTSRFTEVFYRGNTVLLKDHGIGKRKYRYSIEGVLKEDYYIPIDSALPNRLFKESYLSGELSFLNLSGELTSEIKVSERSRLDFKIGDTYIEVKGVSLELDGLALFPGAPTERGIRHLRELARLSTDHRVMMVYLVVARARAFSILPQDRAYKEAFMELKDRINPVALAYEGFPLPRFKSQLPILECS